jgi:hypothetical protein
LLQTLILAARSHRLKGCVYTQLQAMVELGNGTTLQTHLRFLFISTCHPNTLVVALCSGFDPNDRPFYCWCKPRSGDKQILVERFSRSECFLPIISHLAAFKSSEATTIIIATTLSYTLVLWSTGQVRVVVLVVAMNAPYP